MIGVSPALLPPDIDDKPGPGSVTTDFVDPAQLSRRLARRYIPNRRLLLCFYGCRHLKAGKAQVCIFAIQQRPEPISDRI
jgi:hypothetical protein